MSAIPEFPPTFCHGLHGFPYAPVEGPSISRPLERQATPPVLHHPMVEGGRGLGVHKVLPQSTLQDHLSNHTTDTSFNQSTCQSINLSINHHDNYLAVLYWRPTSVETRPEQ